MSFVDRAGSFLHDLAIVGGMPIGCTGLLTICLAGTYLAVNFSRTGQITFEEPTSAPTSTATATQTPLPSATPLPTATPLPSLDCQNIGIGGTAWRAYQMLKERNVVPEPRQVIYIDLAWGMVGLPSDFKGVPVDPNNLPPVVGPEDYLCFQKMQPHGTVFSNPRSLHPLQRKTLHTMGYQVRPPKKL